MQANPAVFFRTWGNDNISYGPVELPALVDWVRKGRVSRNTWVFSESKGEWSRAADMTELKTLFKSKAAAGTQASPATHGIAPESLRRIKIFAEMDERQLASFLQYMEVIKFLPNAVIFNKGEHGDAMFLVLQGELRARVMVGGRESTLSIMGVGDCLGELAIIDESPRSADVLANTESILLKISAGALKQLFKEAPALAAPFLMSLSKTITSRVRTLTKRYEDSILFARTAGTSRD
jgi:CRP/FNR family transcriptional regulator, cyclic AMP receptor protein